MFQGLKLNEQGGALFSILPSYTKLFSKENKDRQRTPLGDRVQRLPSPFSPPQHEDASVQKDGKLCHQIIGNFPQYGSLDEFEGMIMTSLNGPVMVH